MRTPSPLLPSRSSSPLRSRRAPVRSPSKGFGALPPASKCSITVNRDGSKTRCCRGSSGKTACVTFQPPKAKAPVLKLPSR